MMPPPTTLLANLKKCFVIIAYPLIVYNKIIETKHKVIMAKLVFDTK
jgi:hypothetical protein